MQIYTVHIDPLSAADDRGAVIIAECFSGPAAAFSILLALYHVLWDWARVLLAVGLALADAVGLSGLDPVGAVAVEIGFAVLVGAGSNDWRRWVLARRGYRLDDIVSAADMDDAEQRYFSRAPMAE